MEAKVHHIRFGSRYYPVHYEAYTVSDLHK